MTDSASDTLTGFFERLQVTGDESAVRHLWEHFCPRLTGLARRVFHNRPNRQQDAEDAVLSGFAAFVTAAQLGRISGDVDRESLWRLLKVFVVRKINRRLEYESAESRGGGRVRTETDWGADRGNEGLDQYFGTAPTQEFDMAVEELLALLSEESREIALLKFSGYTNLEIAQNLNCSERRIERKLYAIRQDWASRMSDSVQ